MQLEDCGILREDILNGVVNKIIEDLDERLENEIESKINSTINNLIKQKASSIIEESLQKQVDSFIHKEYQPVTAWGEKIGKPTTVSEVIQNSFVNWWETKLDNRGKLTDSWGAKQTRAEYFVKKIAEDVISGAVKNDFDKLVQESNKQIKQAMSKAITEIIEKKLK